MRKLTLVPCPSISRIFEMKDVILVVSETSIFLVLLFSGFVVLVAAIVVAAVLTVVAAFLLIIAGVAAAAIDVILSLLITLFCVSIWCASIVIFVGFAIIVLVKYMKSTPSKITCHRQTTCRARKQSSSSVKSDLRVATFVNARLSFQILHVIFWNSNAESLLRVCFNGVLPFLHRWHDFADPSILTPWATNIFAGKCNVLRGWFCAYAPNYEAFINNCISKSFNTRKFKCFSKSALVKTL